MRQKIAELIATLRREDVAVSVAEAIDAAQAAAAAGVERVVLCDALAATLVKDERDRSVFLAAFAAVFPAHAADVTVRKKPRRRSAGSGAETGGGAGRTSGAAGSASVAQPGPGAAPAPSRRQPSRSGESDEERNNEATRDRASAEAQEAADRDGDAAGLAHVRVNDTRRLRRLPFRAMTPADVEACAPLARALAARVAARVRRRLAPRKSGRLDFRRTIRAAVPHAGVPFERRYRGRRPGPPSLVALCDLSVSTATATDFFLAVLAPAMAHFRRVRFFGFVDRLVEIEFVNGQVRPAGAIDLMARSDFGRVLKDLAAESAALLDADTVLLVLGDARNNRRPPRADLLAAARTRVRRLVWLNPDARERWNTGDSVIAAYARYADALVACGSFAELEQAVAAVAKL